MPVNSKKFIFPLLAAVLACPARADVAYCMKKPTSCTYNTPGIVNYWNQRVNSGVLCDISDNNTGQVAMLYATACATGGSESTSEFKTTSSLTFDTNNLENNKYCWCRIVGPAVSNVWVSVAQAHGQNVSQLPTNRYTTSAANCIFGCAIICADTMARNADFRNKMLSSLE